MHADERILDSYQKSRGGSEMRCRVGKIIRAGLAGVVLLPNFMGAI